MVQNEITIVSAFYDIQRENLDDFKRDNTKYFDYFSFWAGLKNNLIVYTTEEYKDKILEIRTKHNLQDKTIVITKPLEEFDKEVLQKIKKTFSEFNQSKGRKNPQNIECISPIYCYLTYLKPYFVCDAINRGITTQKIVWLDFGFNHGGSYFLNKEQFNFKLIEQNGLQEDKINLFCIKQEIKEHIAEIYFNMDVFLIAGLMYANQENWLKFKEYFKEALEAFLSFGIVDDEQVLMVWIYRKYPNEFNIVRCCLWFDSLLNFIPQDISKKLEVKKQKYYKIIKQQMQEKIINKQYATAMKLYCKYVFYKFIKANAVN